MVQLLFFISTSAAFFGDVADEVALLNCERLGICPGETLDQQLRMSLVPVMPSKKTCNFVLHMAIQIHSRLQMKR